MKISSIFRKLIRRGGKYTTAQIVEVVYKSCLQYNIHGIFIVIYHFTREGQNLLVSSKEVRLPMRKLLIYA